jgi:hypothetical protein
MLQLNDKKATTLASRYPPERRWALLRLVLGFAQAFGASLGVTLLLQTGVTKGALLAVTLTGLCTTVSVLLFGGRRRRS